MEPYKEIILTSYRNGIPEEKKDIVAEEAPYTLFLNDKEFVTLVCSPTHLRELAAGFLCSEGILNQPGDLKDITINMEDGIIWAETTSAPRAQGEFLKRYITSCCGRGRSSFYFINDARDIVPVQSPLRVTPAAMLRLAEELEDRASLFKATGGAHGAALCQGEKILLSFEDIGRHNAVDKIYGHCFLNQIKLSDKIIVFSGRVSSEITIKVARMGVPVLVSRSAPTSLGLEMAQELGITLAGFARGNKINIYTHPERIKQGKPGDGS